MATNTLKPILRMLVVLLGFGLGLGLTAAPAAAQPALFVAEDEDTRIYLFGTVHYVPCDLAAPSAESFPAAADHLGSPCAVWMTPAIEQALRSADQIWVESADSVEDPAVQALIAELAFFTSGRLSDFIPAAEVRLIADALSPFLGIPGSPLALQLEALRPWYLLTLLVELSLAQSGLSHDYGVDQEIMRIAGDFDIPLHGFETAAEQLRLFADDPIEAQATDLREMVVLLQHDIDLAAFVRWIYDQMWTVWMAGDLEGAARVEQLLFDDDAVLALYGDELAQTLGVSLDALKKLVDATTAVVPENPAARSARYYERYIAQRNDTWLQSLRELLTHPGTFFIAVGTGHFVGDAALQTLLDAEDGVTVRRVQ